MSEAKLNIGDQRWRQAINLDPEWIPARDVGFEDGCKGKPRKGWREAPYAEYYLHGYRAGFTLRKVDFLNDLAAMNYIMHMIEPRYQKRAINDRAFAFRPRYDKGLIRE